MIIIIPLHVPLGYPCDYIDQTAKILSENNFIIFLDYHYPYPWKSLLNLNNLKTLTNSFIDISQSKKNIYFRAPSLLPFSKLKSIWNLNKKFGFFILSVFLWILKKKVIIWQFYPLFFKKFDHIFVYDCVDNLNIIDHSKEIYYKEKKLFNISDAVFFNSRGLFEKKSKANSILKKKSIVTVCGCNTKLFHYITNKIPKEFINILQKKIVFMGVFDYRVDVKLLDYIVIHNKNLKFIFIGQIDEKIEKEFFKIIKEKNVLYLGKKEKNELPQYLKNCDLGIIPYDTRREFAKYSNPMKAYEYLACGVPVVSTKILALEDYPKDIVYTTDNKKEFSQAIRRLMSDWNNEKITIAKNIAEKNSWKNKIKIIEKFINKNEKTN